MSDKFFTANKQYYEKRVDIYSIPGASEVIFHDEFNKKFNEKLDQSYPSSVSHTTEPYLGSSPHEIASYPKSNKIIRHYSWKYPLKKLYYFLHRLLGQSR